MKVRVKSRLTERERQEINGLLEEIAVVYDGVTLAPDVFGVLRRFGVRVSLLDFIAATESGRESWFILHRMTGKVPTGSLPVAGTFLEISTCKVGYDPENGVDLFEITYRIVGEECVAHYGEIISIRC